MKKKPPIISDEDKQLFRDAVAHVKPLKTTERIEKITDNTKKIVPNESTLEHAPIKSHDTLSEENTLFSFDINQPDIDGDDVISFSHTGLQHKSFSKLKQGKLTIEATLDLHEHTSDEALQKTNQFLIRCQNRGFKTVCIIHGKGHFSVDQKPILKNLLNNYLRGHTCVLAFHSAKNKQGGTGAMIVMIRAK